MSDNAACSGKNCRITYINDHNFEKKILHSLQMKRKREGKHFNLWYSWSRDSVFHRWKWTLAGPKCKFPANASYPPERLRKWLLAHHILRLLNKYNYSSTYCLRENKRNRLNTKIWSIFYPYSQLTRPFSSSLNSASISLTKAVLNV